MRSIRTVGIVGAGVIGAGWAARCLAHGLDVIAWDPAADGERVLRDKIANAWPALTRVGLFPGASMERLRYAGSVEEVARAADLIQESAPERLDLKTDLHARLDALAAADVVIASSTSGLKPSDFQARCRHPGRVLVGHPFNPVYLLPLVEVVGGARTDRHCIDAAMAFYESIGMYPLRVRNEIEGFLSDRLQEALWRENLHLVNDGVATTRELDDAIVYGPGLRWAFMGVNKTFALAGGDEGMRHMLRQFGPALALPWTRLAAPELTDGLIERMVEGTGSQLEGWTIREFERRRDDCLIAIMQALRTFGEGAGAVLEADEARRIAAGGEVPRWHPDLPVAAPLALYRCRVLPEWVDYNGHMTEAAYLTAFGWASDALFRYIGDDEAYRAAGHSFYTVETHLNYLREVSSGEPLAFTTTVLGVDGKRLHIYHEMRHGGSGDLVCTTEQMLVHVDTGAGRSAPILEPLRSALAAIAGAHAVLPRPVNAGRAIGLPER